MSKPVWISRVVSRDIIRDMVASIQNLFGARLKGYEKMSQNGFDEIQKELKEKYPNGKLLWYRYEITQFTDGALFIVMYGEMDGV